MKETIFDREHSAIFQTYKRLHVEIARAEGCRIYDVEGNSYLDFLAGIAVNALGHSHPRIIAAIESQARKYLHVSNYFYQEPQVRLAELIREESGFSKVFFCNSGAESLEGAMKLARRWGNPQGKTEMFGFSGGFHGRTYAALSLMDKPLYKDGMEPFLPNTHVLPFNDVSALSSAINEKTAAIVLEFVQGEGGVSVVRQEFVQEILRLQKQFDFLLIADEVQAGVGRTGKFFAFEHFGIKPDIVMMAKGVGGGLPLGAIVGNERVENLWQAGMNGTTYGGNALACAAGAVVMEELQNGLLGRVVEAGTYLREQLERLQAEFPTQIAEVRGLGLMMGLRVAGESAPLVASLLNNGVIANATSGDVIRLVPPLIVTNADIDECVNALRKVFSEKELV